ncbi:MAG: HAMP domain-containing histidine kinase [Cephaloticoccus sp.]|nr:HAMP domain-containing histidine kinase [Cephaloticoccus sp.]MCF7760511.1 HAMP domain-containing histidine kinase [Cephaloticoccus sp.]
MSSVPPAQRVPLAWRLLLPFVAMVVVLAGTGVWLSWRQMTRQLISQELERAQTITRVAQFAADSANSRTEMSRLIRMLAAGGDVKLLLVTGNPAGTEPRVMIASEQSLQGLLVSRLTAAGIADAAVSALGTEADFTAYAVDTATFTHVTNLASERSVPLAHARVLLQLDASRTQRQIQADATLNLTGAATLGLIAILAFAWLLRRRVLRPLQSVLKGLHSPELAAAAAADGSREISTLATVLASTLAEVGALNRDLEQRVRQRTVELAASLDRERETGLLKTNFMGMISHEFRNSMTQVLSSAQILLRYPHRLDEDERVRHLHRIESSCQRFTDVLEDTLIYCRTETGSIVINPLAIDTAAFFREEIAGIQTATPTTIQLEMAPDAPPTLLSDETLLQHIISNLLANAVKYSPMDAPISVIVSVNSAGHPLVSIRDRGIGIPSDELPRLGEPFLRGSNVGNITGTGLGLVVVKRCLDLLGGKLAFESDIGRGTTVTVTLPPLPPTE